MSQHSAQDRSFTSVNRIFEPKQISTSTCRQDAQRRVTLPYFTCPPKFYAKAFAMSARKRKIDLEGSDRPEKRQDTEINPWTGQKYSTRYYEILAKRKELPVFEQKAEFIHNLKTNQVIVLQGETGSGKTTQVNLQPHSNLLTL